MTEKQMRNLPSGSFSQVPEHFEEGIKKIRKAHKDKKVFKADSNSMKRDVKDCKFCGQTHPYDKKQCPAFGRKCNKCQDMNHFATKCRSSKKVKSMSTASAVSSSDEDFDEEQVLSISDNKPIKGKVATACVEFLVDDEIFTSKCQLDTAATCNVIGLGNLTK